MPCRSTRSGNAAARSNSCGTCARSLNGARYIYKTTAVRGITFCSVHCLQIKVTMQMPRAVLRAAAWKPHLGFNSQR